MKITVIINREKEMKILSIFKNKSIDETWGIANSEEFQNKLKNKNLEDYDVLIFDNLEELNDFILDN